MRLLGVIVLEIILSACFHPLLAEDQPAAPVVQFKWAFLLRDQDGNTKKIDFNEKVTVHKGDSLRIYLEPSKNTYLYLYMFDAQKQLHCIFPVKPDSYEKNREAGTTSILPSADKWYIMDKQTGTERFYLLASSARLNEIEYLTKKMTSSPNDAEVKAKLLDEIKTVRRAKGDISTPVEKGVPIAGTVVAVTRGPTIDATLTEASGFYSRTLRIEHE